MSDKDIQVSNEFSLDALLGQAMEKEEVASDPIVEQGFNSPIPSFLGIPQMTSSSYPNSVRHDSSIFVRGDDMIVISVKEDGADDYTRYYTNHLRIALVDIQKSQRGRETLVARTMWPMTEDGQRNMATDDNKPACRSQNGFGPTPNFIGKEIYDPRNGVNVKIGFDSNGEPFADSSTTCSRCPFSKWERGKKPPQPCKPTTAYIVWVAPQKMVKAAPNGTFSEVTFPSVESGGMMVRLNGQNTGLELALGGRTEKQMGKMADGSAIKALRSYYLPSGDIARIYRDGSKPVPPAAQKYVVGVAKTKRAADFVPMVWGTAIEEEIAAGIKWVILEAPAYDVYPEGNPLQVGEMTTVLPLAMTVGKNDFDIQKTSIPVFKVDTEHPMSDEEFGSFLREKMRYNAPMEDSELTIRESMMGIDYTLSDGQTRLNEYRIAVSNPAVAALPEGGIQDAEYEELVDDMD